MKHNNTTILSFLLFIILISSCRQEIDIREELPEIPEPTVLVETSVMGIVQTEGLIAVEGAAVELGTELTFTDENGVFQFKNIILPENQSFVTVEKEGYFLGSRKFYPKKGNENKIEIELMEKEVVGNFQSSVGGDIEFEEVKLHFEDNGIVDENGNAYNGHVTVEGKYLDPTLISTHRQMPGDLTAIDENNEVVSLTSYAMIAVELIGDNGEKLQLAEGSPCITEFPIPESLQNSAPDEIELWSFDNTLGSWVEEGVAINEGGVYVAEIPHFSFWNCDVPRDYVTLDINVLNNHGPFANALIKITEVIGGNYRTALTNDNGFVSGLVPSNTELLLEILDNCNSVIYSQNLGILTSDLTLNINTNFNNFSSVIGSVTTCADEISEAAYVRLENENHIQYVSINDNNEYSTTISYCDPLNTIKAIAIDPLELLASPTQEKPISTSITFENLEMCNILLEEQLIFEFGDTTLIYNNSSDLFFTYTISTIQDTNGEIEKYLIDVTTLDWNTGETSNFIIIHKVFNPDSQISFTFPSFGFSVEGVNTSYIIENDGIQYLKCEGELTNFTILNQLFWDPSYNPLTFDFVIKL